MPTPLSAEGSAVLRFESCMLREGSAGAGCPGWAKAVTAKKIVGNSFISYPSLSSIASRSLGLSECGPHLYLCPPIRKSLAVDPPRRGFPSGRSAASSATAAAERHRQDRPSSRHSYFPVPGNSGTAQTGEIG